MENRYGFGKNWQKFNTLYSQERQEGAKSALLASLGRDHLQGLDMLDIGCGSGLHSLAAWQSGANVTSFDYDPDSVAATRHLWQTKAGKPENWHIAQGSVLDDAYMRAAGIHDIVYSWGVLHHTGDVWQALQNAVIPLKSDGILLIALYSYTAGRNGAMSGHSPSPEKWLDIKQDYNRRGAIGKRLMEAAWLRRAFFAGGGQAAF